MNKILALVLAIAAIVTGLKGYQLYQESTAGFSVLGIEVSASDAEVRQQAFVYWGMAAIAVVGALFFFRKR